MSGEMVGGEEKKNVSMIIIIYRGEKNSAALNLHDKLRHSPPCVISDIIW